MDHQRTHTYLIATFTRAEDAIACERATNTHLDYVHGRPDVTRACLLRSEGYGLEVPASHAFKDAAYAYAAGYQAAIEDRNK